MIREAASNHDATRDFTGIEAEGRSSGHGVDVADIFSNSKPMISDPLSLILPGLGLSLLGRLDLEAHRL